MRCFSIVLTALILVPLTQSAWAACDLTHGQETYHKWVQVYDRQPDRVFVDKASIQREHAPQVDATLMKHHESSAAVANGPSNRTEVNHIQVNCRDNTYSVRFQAEYMPNGTLTKSHTFDETREFQEPASDTYFKDVVDFVCGQIR